MPTDIFISYANEDYKRVRGYYRKLRGAGYHPWMDKKNLTPGIEWENKIKETLKNLKVAIIFLSKNTRKNDRFFSKELSYIIEARNVGNSKFLIIPARLEKCAIPAVLQKIHCPDLFAHEWKNVLKTIESHLALPSTIQNSVERTKVLPFTNLKLPCFFPSISSTAKSTFNVLEHLEILVLLNYPNFLISAYDIHELKEKRKSDSRKIIKLISKAREQKSIVLLDSGNYEKYWRKIEKWTQKSLIEILSYVDVDLAFCYDKLKPSEEIGQVVAEVEQSVGRDQKAADMKIILPIVHACSAGQLPEICKQVSENLNPILIAVPEREMGEGIYNRARTVIAIRNALDSTGRYFPLHILGTGNPLSLLIFAACGADSFDGLEWCQTSVDHITGRLYHSQLCDFFVHQTSFEKNELGYAAKTLLHNLLFYQKWMAMIQDAMEKNTMPDLLKTYLPEKAFNDLKRLCPEVF